MICITCIQLYNTISYDIQYNIAYKVDEQQLLLYHQGYKCNIMEKVTVRHLTPELECHEH